MKDQEKEKEITFDSLNIDMCNIYVDFLPQNIEINRVKWNTLGRIMLLISSLK